MRLPFVSNRRTAASVSAEGRKLPGRFPWAIKSGVQPRLFFRSHTFGSAPLSANTCTNLGQLLYAAPCIAELPFLSTAFMSALCCNKYSTVWMASSSVPADSSPSDNTPTPAAANNGVQRSIFVRQASAPSSTNSWTSGKSPASAASNRGVASVRLSASRFVRRFACSASTFAPWKREPEPVRGW